MIDDRAERRTRTAFQAADHQLVLRLYSLVYCIALPYAIASRKGYCTIVHSVIINFHDSLIWMPLGVEWTPRHRSNPRIGLARALKGGESVVKCGVDDDEHDESYYCVLEC